MIDLVTTFVAIADRLPGASSVLVGVLVVA